MSSCRLPQDRWSFNPRAREGATRVFAVYTHVDRVSIHAPVKARLAFLGITGLVLLCFNPRAREGATRSSVRLLHF